MENVNLFSTSIINSLPQLAILQNMKCVRIVNSCEKPRMQFSKSNMPAHACILHEFIFLVHVYYYSVLNSFQNWKKNRSLPYSIPSVLFRTENILLIRRSNVIILKQAFKSSIFNNYHGTGYSNAVIFETALKRRISKSENCLWVSCAI